MPRSDSGAARRCGYSRSRTTHKGGLTGVISDVSQNFAAMPQQNAEVFKILLCQIADDREVNGVLGEALGVLGQAELFEPARDLLHRALPHGFTAA